MSKRVKIKLSEGTPIPPEKIYETNKRIREEMTPFIREHIKKQIESEEHAKKLIINT